MKQPHRVAMAVAFATAAAAAHGQTVLNDHDPGEERHHEDERDVFLPNLLMP